MRERIVYTQLSGCVSVIVPSRACYLACTNGGAKEPYRRQKWWIDRQIAQFVRGGIDEAVARDWVLAIAWGGLTSSEYFGLLRDKDMTKDGRGAELWDVAELPSDRWFRNAWRRSSNGGPIWIDLDAARDIQVERIEQAVHGWNERAKRDERCARLRGRLTNGPALIEFDLDSIGRKIVSARTAEEICAVWPPELPRPSYACWQQ
jgi:hypothetical protein